MIWFFRWHDTASALCTAGAAYRSPILYVLATKERRPLGYGLGRLVR